MNEEYLDEPENLGGLLDEFHGNFPEFDTSGFFIHYSGKKIIGIREDYTLN